MTADNVPKTMGWLAFAGLLAAAAMLLAFSFVSLAESGWWALRGGVLALAIAVAWMVPRHTHIPSVLMPPLFLAVLALVLYCVLPALFVRFHLGGGAVAIQPGEGPEAVFIPGALISYDMARRAVQSSAEMAILRFALLGLGTAACIGFCARLPSGRCPSRLDAVLWGGIAAAMLSALRLIPLNSLVMVSQQEWAGQLFAVLPAVEMASLALLTVAVLEGRPGAGWRLAKLVPVALGAFLPFGAKVLGFGVPICLLAVLVGRSTLRIRVACIGVILIIPVLIVLVLGMQRHTIYSATTLHMAAKHLMMKLVYRQAETVYCFEFAQRRPGEGGIGPAFLGLIPRVLWPGKPNLSQGARYAHEFCGWSEEDVVASRHSASITLLGEPVAMAGTTGLAWAVGAILAVLTVTGWSLVAGGPAGAAVLALLPWILDFDQLFGLWMANLGKFGLVVVVAIWCQVMLASGGKVAMPRFMRWR